MTSIVQPIDHGISKLVKKKYRHKLLNFILADDKNNVVEELNKEVMCWMLCGGFRNHVMKLSP